MLARKAEVTWEGNLREGFGRFRTGSGKIEGEVTFASRFENKPGTNPEELIGAAHASCFSMALAGTIQAAGFRPYFIHTRAQVKLDKTAGGFRITGVDLVTEAKIGEIDDATFQAKADEAKRKCPVSQALTGVSISLTATLVR